MDESAPPRLVVGAVIVDDLEAPTRLLAARRLSGPSCAAGRWEFPGGKVDPGETAEQALVRELQEELGFTARLGTEILNSARPTWPISATLAMRVWWVVAAEGVPTRGAVHSEIRWLDFDRADLLDWLDADLAVLPQVLGRDLRRRCRDVG